MTDPHPEIDDSLRAMWRDPAGRVFIRCGAECSLLGLIAGLVIGATLWR